MLNKYIKYKKKYLYLKNKIGGHLDNENKTSISRDLVTDSVPGPVHVDPATVPVADTASVHVADHVAVPVADPVPVPAPVPVVSDEVTDIVRDPSSLSSSNPLIKKKFILTCGPTGSGKSSVKKIMESEFSISDIKEILIDDLIEQDNQYTDQLAVIKENNKQDLDVIIKDLEKITKDDRQDVDNMIENKKDILTSIINKYTDSYFDIRKDGCKEQCKGIDLNQEFRECKIIFNEEPSKCNCNVINDINLCKSLKNHEHIIFESTCNKSMEWIIKILTSKDYINKYELIIVHVFVNINTIKHRIIKRFLDKYKNGNPRLPNFMIIDSIYDEIIKNMINLHSNCKAQNYQMYILNNNNHVPDATSDLVNVTELSTEEVKQKIIEFTGMTVD